MQDICQLLDRLPCGLFRLAAGLCREGGKHLPLGAAAFVNGVAFHVESSFGGGHRASWHVLCKERGRHDKRETHMAISFTTPHEQFLGLRAQRSEVLSSNIANADTPNYKARDYDFADAMREASGSAISMSMKATNAKHQTLSPGAGDGKLMYRVPMQPTLDGNTVETDVEQAAFAENTLKYRASLRFIDGYIKTMRYAIKGGD